MHSSTKSDAKAVLIGRTDVEVLAAVCSGASRRRQAAQHNLGGESLDAFVGAIRRT
jgi:hypothetical protein